MRKPGPPREIPPPLELECLKALWTLGEANVRQVMLALAPRRSLAYTTVMTILDRLARKQAVERRKAGRSFVYSPLLTRETLRRLAVRELVESLFAGSEDELAGYLRQRVPAAQPAATARAAATLDPALL
ncbi:MAG: BlaI/MecI/CopY family transcriptional regulator [Bryobacteraceae bacterium]